MSYTVSTFLVESIGILSKLLNKIYCVLVGSASHPSHGSSSPAYTCSGTGWPERGTPTQGTATAVGVWNRAKGERWL